MTPIPVKCPECGLSNWSTDPNCKRCKFIFQVEAAASGNAIRMPSQALPESSFADLYEPDYDGGIVPSHSQTPQMAARIAAARHSAGENQKYDQFLTPKAEMRQMPPENPAPPVFRENGNQRQPVNPMMPVKTKNGIAAASMILGILGFLTAIVLIGFVFAVIGLILGIAALVKISKKPNVYGGKAFAIVGIVLGALTVLTLPIIAAIAIPNFLAARRAANESGAISAIRTLSAVETSYMAVNSSTKCADLKELGAANSIDSVLASGEKNGYRFQIVNSPFGGCEITATPVSASTGTRSFYFSTEDGIVRAGQKDGRQADKNDAPLN